MSTPDKLLVEHVARSLCYADDNLPDGLIQEDDGTFTPCWKQYIEMAESAIKAINSYKHPNSAVQTLCGIPIPTGYRPHESISIEVDINDGDMSGRVVNGTKTRGDDE
jgi:hypothetical protein